MLDQNLKSQLAALLTKLRTPVELVASLGDDERSRELWSLLTEIAGLHSDVTATSDGRDERRPSFHIRRVGTEVGVRFAGIPLGHEFTSLALALLQVGGHPPRITDELASTIRDIEGDLRFETYFSLSCQSCPDVVQALNLMSVVNPRISHVAIEGGLFREEAEAREVLSVPAVFLNGRPFAQGRMQIEQLVSLLDTGAAARAASTIAAKEPFDVLVVGGGPAAAAAAVYAARKGIRTAIVAERLGGQVADTMAIENFISVPHTEGPRMVQQLETHVAEYGVDVMSLQRAERLVPAHGPHGMHEVRLASGASVRARTVVVATGARWRQVGVPGEDVYRNKGVTYCPHCDGPLFRGKRVAVIGGGNSGAEAAIDLAGVAEHVTLIEFAPDLRADAVLQDRLRTSANVSLVLGASTTQILGDGTRVTGLEYVERETEASRRLTLDGVFVQIGLIPNTDWLRGTVELSECGEIEVDANGATSARGIFAAGDATTTPFKQIIIAMGEGAKASLSAFDHLIRSPGLPIVEAVS